jgi:TonB family protein
MQQGRAVVRALLWGALVAGIGPAAAEAQSAWVPAQLRDGALPPIPLQAIGGGEVLLEVGVDSDGAVTAVRTLRATPPFTDLLAEAVQAWRFVPAEREVPPLEAAAPEPRPREPVDSKVLVAGMFRPPSISTPTIGEAPQDVGLASVDIPLPIATVMPPYPPLALDSGIVLVEVLVDTLGDVADVWVIRSAPPFDELAMEAVRLWKFQPARLDGMPVESLAYVVVAFRQPVTSPGTAPPPRP